jgi:molecular chaperone GrpE
LFRTFSESCAAMLAALRQAMTMTDSQQDSPPDTPATDTNENATASVDVDGTFDADSTAREIQELKDRHLRLAAEYDNFRRRAAKERQEAGWRAQGELVRGLLDALDDINRFANVDPASVDAKTVVDGVAIVEKKLVKSLAGHGFELVDPTDHPFDPAHHEAVSTTPAARAEEDGTVATTFQVGYMINGVVLRPARVVVRQWSGAPAAGASASSGDVPLVS